MALKVAEDIGWVRKDALQFGPAMGFLNHEFVSVIGFALLAASLFYFARKPLEGGKG